MKIVFTLLLVAISGRYHEMQYGTSIDKAAFGEYYLKKLANSTFQDIDSRARTNRWFRHFKKYCTLYRH